MGAPVVVPTKITRVGVADEEGKLIFLFVKGLYPRSLQVECYSYPRSGQVSCSSSGGSLRKSSPREVALRSLIRLCS